MIISELEAKCKKIPEQEKEIEFYIKTDTAILGPFNSLNFYYGTDSEKIIAWIEREKHVNKSIRGPIKDA